jgi:hypothetical protein
MKQYEVLLRSGGSGQVVAEGYTRIGELVMFFRGPSKGWVATYRSDFVSSIRDVSPTERAAPQEAVAVRA